MLSLSILENKSNSILYEIPPGKPNPTQECSLGEDRRERVLQTRMKGASCWYYTFNFIRKRIGKNPSQELLTERAIEVLCSQRRKELTAYDNAFPVSIAELFSESDSSVLKRVNLENAQFFLESQSSLLCDLSESVDGRTNIALYVQEFIKEKNHDNLYDFLIYKRSSKVIEVSIKFLSKFKTDVHTLIEHPRWKEFDAERKGASLDAYVRDFSADLYNLKRFSWKPVQGIDKLINELKEKGPLMIFGYFGVPSYIDEPFKTNQKISGRDIYAWRPGANRNESVAGHSVLLVGAKKTQDKAFAYFIDSCDPSDPSDKNKQKIYMMSFTNLTSNICSLTGRKTLDCEIGFGYYGNFKI